MTYQYRLCFFIVLNSLFISQNVFAKAEVLNDELVSCSQVNNNQARLTCFDAFVAKNKESSNESLSLEAQPVNSKITQSPSAQDIEGFAKEQLKKTKQERAKEVKSITLTISALSKTAYGKWKINFVNGQKWQQKDNTKLNLKKGQRVVLTKGVLNAVYLQKENTNKRIAVKRLK